MKTIETSLLVTVSGGVYAPKFRWQGGCPADTAYNNGQAKLWISSMRAGTAEQKAKVTPDALGHFTKKGDGPNTALYGWEYVNKGACAPGGGD